MLTKKGIGTFLATWKNGMNLLFDFFFILGQGYLTILVRR